MKSVEPGTPYLETDPLPVHLVIPQFFQNTVDAHSYGTEVSVNLNVTSSWKLSAAYSWFMMNNHPQPSSQYVASTLNGDAPEHQYQFRSYYTFFRTFAFDVSIYYVGCLVDQGIPRYFRLDTRVARRFGEWTELSVVGQNLLDDHHFEYGQTLETALATQARRSVYGKVSWRF